MAHRRQAAQMARVPHERLRQQRPEAIDAQPLLVGGRGLPRGRHGLCERGALGAQTGQERETAGDRQPLGGRGKQALAVCLRARVPPFGTEAPAGMARQEVGPPEPMGRMLTHHVSTFAQHIPPCAGGLWGDGAVGQPAQSSPLGSPPGLGMVIRLLQTAVGWHGCRVGPIPPGVCFQQPSDEPGPVGGRCDDHARDGRVIRGSWLQKRGEMMGEASLRAPVVLRMQ